MFVIKLQIKMSALELCSRMKFSFDLQRLKRSNKSDFPWLWSNIKRNVQRQKQNHSSVFSWNFISLIYKTAQDMSFLVSFAREKFQSIIVFHHDHKVFNYMIRLCIMSNKEDETRNNFNFLSIAFFIFFLRHLQLQLQASLFPATDSTVNLVREWKCFNFCLRSRHAEQFSLSKCAKSFAELVI